MIRNPWVWGAAFLLVFLGFGSLNRWVSHKMQRNLGSAVIANSELKESKKQDGFMQLPLDFASWNILPGKKADDPAKFGIIVSKDASHNNVAQWEQGAKKSMQGVRSISTVGEVKDKDKVKISLSLEEYQQKVNLINLEIESVELELESMPSDPELLSKLQGLTIMKATLESLKNKIISKL